MMSIKKDNKGRNLKQNEDQLKDGRYRYRYINKYGERKAIYAWKLTTTDKTPSGKKEDICLREKIKNLEKDLNDDIDIASANMTVNQLIERYIESKPQLANTTKQNHIILWNAYIKNNRLGIMKVGNVRKSDILAFYSYVYQKHKFKPSTMQTFQNFLYPAFQLAVDDMIIRMNPCRNCMKDYKTKSYCNQKYALTAKEQKSLLDFVKNNQKYNFYYCMLSFMISTGCRIGEMLGLTWEDINFEKKYVLINHQVIYKKKDEKIQFYATLPKYGEIRKIPLQDGILKILKEYKKDTIFISMSSGFNVDGYTNFVFVNQQGGLQTPVTIGRIFHRIVKEHNLGEVEKASHEKRTPVLLPDFTPHTLRHTFCTRMAENGIDIKVLQEIMGHKDINITMQVYNHVTFDRTQEAVTNTKEILEISI